ncbi:peptide/nickel transport system permease protein [Actinacidiphila yanglinensis]|uniref:Peptide/nickel transport system permease protein n=1 Tax=Actinacidiphila yanglinensis TaxID=310779 RepID=A0A1H6E3I5_9ACTN|nr:ABC transporter permease [Actinacidiphila yanglinensis]SEG91803.1 peptide/nickel transport system permease protein [Actinacidiphila yanglinensis]
MTTYLLRRVGQAIVVIIGVMIVTFALIHLEPGSAARATLGIRANSERIAVFNAANGLNRPLAAQFATFVKQAAEGNFGTSYSMHQPVSTLITQRLPRDAVLLGLSTLVALAIALPMGIYQAVRRGRAQDHAFTVVSFVLYSMPDFFFALLLIAVFSVQFHLLPSQAPQAQSVGGILSDPRGLVLPVVTLSLVSVAGFSRYMRSSAIGTLAQDYILVARAKGLPNRLVLRRHVLRNSLLPVITVLGLQAPAIVTGAVIAESVFNYPGMGLLFYQAATSKDYPVLLGSTLVVGVATVVGSLLADIAYSLLDPRIRYDHS